MIFSLVVYFICRTSLTRSYETNPYSHSSAPAKTEVSDRDIGGTIDITLATTDEWAVENDPAGLAHIDLGESGRVCRVRAETIITSEAKLPPMSTSP